MLKTVVIEKMIIEDLDLISETLQTDFDDFWNYNVFKSELENENSKYIVAKKNGKILGFAGIWIAIDVAHITNIVVKKDCRRCGIGNVLLLELVKMCEELNLDEITLEVNEHNVGAIKLYEKLGFEKVGLRKRYYDKTDDAIIMTKVLKK